MPDANGNPVEGDVRTNRVDPSRTAVFHNGQWYERPPTRGNQRSPAQVATPDNPDPPMAPMTPGSENRARIALGFGPAVAGERQLESGERASRSGNPLHDDWGAVALEAVPFDGGAAARAVGGDDYQQYRQGAAAFEAAILPVLSGAAVTPSEAQRQVRANLPQFGDTRDTLTRKARNRQQMLNAAADLAGRPRPFPQAGTWNFEAPPQQQAAPARRPASAPARRPPPNGYRVLRVD